MAFGLMFARVTSAWCSVLLFVVLELVLAMWIHDNLTLNIIQLIYPIEAIAEWQLAG